MPLVQLLLLLLPGQNNDVCLTVNIHNTSEANSSVYTILICKCIHDHIIKWQTGLDKTGQIHFQVLNEPNFNHAHWSQQLQYKHNHIWLFHELDLQKKQNVYNCSE